MHLKLFLWGRRKTAYLFIDQLKTENKFIWKFISLTDLNSVFLYCPYVII